MLGVFGEILIDTTISISAEMLYSKQGCEFKNRTESSIGKSLGKIVKIATEIGTIILAIVTSWNSLKDIFKEGIQIIMLPKEK